MRVADTTSGGTPENKSEACQELGTTEGIEIALEANRKTVAQARVMTLPDSWIGGALGLGQCPASSTPHKKPNFPADGETFPPHHTLMSLLMSIIPGNLVLYSRVHLLVCELFRPCAPGDSDVISSTVKNRKLLLQTSLTQPCRSSANSAYRVFGEDQVGEECRNGHGDLVVV